MTTSAAAAKHIFLSTSRFRDLVAAGVISHRKNGQYSLNKVREEYISHAQKVMAGRGADGGAVLSERRARLASAQAEKAELQNAVSRGEFVSAKVMKTILMRDYAMIRNLFLGMPGKLGDVLANRSRDEIQSILMCEVRENLTALAKADAVDDIVSEAGGRGNEDGDDEEDDDDKG
jgi:phage terminase Nu1 subunit (DNA packaging protein)